MKSIVLFFSFAIIIGSPFEYFAQNSSASFNGDNSYYTITPNQSLDFSNNFTIEAWVNTTVKIGTLAVLNKVNCATSDGSYSLSIVDGHVQWGFNANGNCNYGSTIKTDDDLVEPGQCTHIAVTHSDEGIELYVNGQWVSYTFLTGSYSDVHTSSEPIRIGVYKSISGSLVIPFFGTIDEVRIWDAAKTPEQIALHYNEELTGSEADLVAYYNFDASSVNGTIVLNQATSGFTLNASYVSATSPVFETSCVIFDAGLSELANTEIPEFTIFPNPAASTVKMEFTNSNTVSEITITDLTGNIIMTVNPKLPVIDIDISTLAPGYYLISVMDVEKKRATKKIIKE